jgi:hypothetical protein
MLKSSRPRLLIDDATADAFTEKLVRFGADLSVSERAVLSALLRSGMDPWSRSMLEPPDLTPEEAAALDRIVGGQRTGE